MRAILLALLVPVLLSGCALGSSDIELAPGWKATSLAVWRGAHPDMLAASADGRWLYLTGETQASVTAPSLMAIHLPSGRHQILLYGLHRADGLKLAPDGSLWIGEEFDEGRIWRIAEPDRFPTEQIVVRSRLDASTAAIAPLPWAGRFSHEGIAFSRDGRFAYLADEHPHGGLYRLDLKQRRLTVLHEKRGWLPIREPDDARAEATTLKARRFNRLEDLETLADGRVLMAETGSGRVLALRDGKRPEISTYLKDAKLAHPDNLAWDDQRRWLWITDDDQPSKLLAWTGSRLLEIAVHRKAEITGVLSLNGRVFINLQARQPGAELTLELAETEPVATE